MINDFFPKEDFILTLEDYVFDMSRMMKSDEAVYVGKWEARLKINKNVTIKRIKDVYGEEDYYAKRLKTKEEMDLILKTGSIEVKLDKFFKGGLRTGDICNLFLTTFYVHRTYDSNRSLVDLNIDFNLNGVNRFLMFFQFPSIDKTMETGEMLYYPHIFLKGGTPIIEEYERGYNLRKIRYYAIRDRKNDYIQCYKMLAYELLKSLLGFARRRIDLTFDNEIMPTKGKVDVKSVMYFDSLNSLVFFDCFEAMKKYKYDLCPNCGTVYFRNRRQKCPVCKPLSKYTKKEADEAGIITQSVSNDYKRKNFLKALNRKFGNLSDKEKNAHLIENGFSPLKRRTERQNKKEK